MPRNTTTTAALLAVVAGSHIEAAWAYIDPNSGGMLFQLLVPVFAAIVAFWAYLRSRIGGALRSIADRLKGHREK